HGEVDRAAFSRRGVAALPGAFCAQRAGAVRPPAASAGTALDEGGDRVGDARSGRFDVVLVWASDRIARCVKHYLEVLDELSRLQIEFVSFRENIDTGGPLGRAIIVIIGAIAELERNLIIERVRAGMRRARLEGRH